MWDFSEGSATQVGSDDLRRLIKLVKPYAEEKAGGKTAMIAPSDFEYGIGRMAEAFADISRLQFRVNVFRNISDAKKWLGVDELPVID